MAAAFSSDSVGRDSSKMFRASESCSVCLDAVNDSGERSIAKLKCGHHFHLDCIGSAFNAKGAMQCPNCRHVEDGQWLYANGSRWNDDFSIEEIAYEDEYESYHAMPNYFGGADAFSHFEWCPYQHGNLQSGGSSYPGFQVSLGEIDVGSIGFPTELAINFSHDYDESGSASSPRLTSHSRQSQVAEDSSSRPPLATGPIRPFDLVGTSNGGSMMGDGEVYNAPSSIWGRHSVGNSNPGFSGDTPSLADRIRPEVDASFYPRTSTNLTTSFGDLGSGLSAHERGCSMLRGNADMAHSHTTHRLGSMYSQQAASDGLHVDVGGWPAGPCPSPHFMHGQVGTSQSQPQSSFLRSAPIGSSRRLRHNGVPASVLSSVRTTPGHNSGEQSRRSSQSWTELSVSLGQEPPVPGLESHGSGYHGGSQGFVPWRRDGGASGPSAGLWSGNTDPPWPAGSRFISDSQSRNSRRADSVEGHSSSRPPADYELFQQSLFMDYSHPFGREGPAEAGSSIFQSVPFRAQR